MDIGIIDKSNDNDGHLRFSKQNCVHNFFVFWKQIKQQAIQVY